MNINAIYFIIFQKDIFIIKVILIGGGSASGKTYVLNKVLENLKIAKSQKRAPVPQ